MDNKSSVVVIFLDVKKAFDSIERSQVINVLKKIGADNNGIFIYEQILHNLKLDYNGEIINYDRGFPQGSLISPMLSNLIYEEVLKEAIAKNWTIYGYATM